MPLIQIQALAQPGGHDTARVLRRLNEAVADAIGAPPRAVWSTWRTLGEGEYAVGGEAPATQPADTHPPLVHIFIARPPEVVERVEQIVEELLVRELGLAPGNVFVRVELGRANA